jgi:protein-disulfide isomerase-like protein with CxxC motif
MGVYTGEIFHQIQHCEYKHGEKIKKKIVVTNITGKKRDAGKKQVSNARRSS